MAEDAVPFPYLRWAKAHLHYGEPLMLGMSGLPRPPQAEKWGLRSPFLPDGQDPELALRKALAERHGVPVEGVHIAAGTSHANFVTYLALARGGHVAAETPGYEAFFRLGPAVGATVAGFDRTPELAGRIDADALRQATPEGTRLIVVTDLHNPTGRRLHPDDLALLLEVADDRDAYVLVDEVYLDMDPLDRPSNVRAGERVLVTNSLTKSHGLGDLRSGWILGAPDVIDRITVWDDLVCPVQPHLPLLETLAWLPHVPEHLAEVRTRCAALTDRVDAWVGSREDVWWVRPHAGFTGLLCLGGRDGDAVSTRAYDTQQVRIVPGSFFQRPDTLRISYWLPEEQLDAALEGLGHALDASS